MTFRASISLTGIRIEFHGSEISNIQGETAERHMATRKFVYKRRHYKLFCKILNNEVYPIKAIALNLRLNMHSSFVARHWILL